MKPVNFLKQRLYVIISYFGLLYEFYAKEENEYHELVPVTDKIITVKGIYHESNGYESQTVADASITHTMPTPMILCMWEDARQVSAGNCVSIGSKIFVVTGKNDIQNYGIACDISLEELDHG